jgi:hypothetical protein
MNYALSIIVAIAKISRYYQYIEERRSLRNLFYLFRSNAYYKDATVSAASTAIVNDFIRKGGRLESAGISVPVVSFESNDSCEKLFYIIK